METILRARDGAERELAGGRTWMNDIQSQHRTLHDDLASVRHMIDAAEHAFEFMAGLDRQKLEQDQKTLFALVRAVESMCEQAVLVSETTRLELPWVPWNEFTELCARMTDEASAVDVDLVSAIVAEKLPEVVEDLRLYLDSRQPRD